MNLETAVNDLVSLGERHDINVEFVLRKDGMIWYAYFCNPAPWERLGASVSVYISEPSLTALEAVVSVRQAVDAALAKGIKN